LAPADIDQAVAEAVYRIAQEALSNAMKHGHASDVLISAHLSQDALTVRVTDNGRGLSPAIKPLQAAGDEPTLRHRTDL
jgi:two-component system NarL family sensor kinase